MNRYCDDMVIDMDDEEFKGRMEIANENVDTLIGYETSVMNIILYLSIVTMQRDRMRHLILI